MSLTLEDHVQNERLYRAFDCMSAKDWGLAEQELQAGLVEAQEEGNAVLTALFYSSLGVLAKLQKDFHRAWKFYDKAEQLLPEDPALKLISARLLMEVFGQYDAAIRRCKKVLEISRSDPPFLHQAYALLGLALLKTGQRFQAAECLQKSMEDDFAGLLSAGNIDLKLLEALIRKKTALEVCRAYLEKALQFSRIHQEERFEALFLKLLEVFPESEEAEEKTNVR